MNKIAANLQLMPGVKETIIELKRQGYLIAIITGGFSFFAEKIAEKIGADYCIANDIEMQDQIFTGNYFLNVHKNKDKHVEKLRTITNAKTIIAVGDGANDIPMLRVADIGVGFCAKKIVHEIADELIHEKNMCELLNILNNRDIIIN